MMSNTSTTKTTFRNSPSPQNFGTKIVKTGARNWYYCIEFTTPERVKNHSRILWFKKNGNHINLNTLNNNDFLQILPSGLKKQVSSQRTMEVK